MRDVRDREKGQEQISDGRKRITSETRRIRGVKREIRVMRVREREGGRERARRSFERVCAPLSEERPLMIKEEREKDVEIRRKVIKEVVDDSARRNPVVGSSNVCKYITSYISIDLEYAQIHD